MNDEPVLMSAIVKGHQFRALLDTESVASEIKCAEMTLNADGQAFWLLVLENVPHDMLLEDIF